MVDEARLADTGEGLAPQGEGWFVVNVADVAWLRHESFGARCIFEADGRLVDERPELFRCSSTRSSASGWMSSSPCVMVMVGARSDDGTILYPRDETAVKHGAGVERDSTSPSEAYAPFGHWRLARPRDVGRASLV